MSDVDKVALFAEALSWQKEGRRSINCEVSVLSGDVPFRIWCYDLDYSSGFFVTKKSEFLSGEKLHKNALAKARAAYEALEVKP